MASEGTANPHDLAALELSHGLGYRADHASGVLQQRNIAGVAADGDGHFPYAEDVEHVELARRKGEPLAGIFRQNLQREGVARLLLHTLNAVGHGQHGVWDRARSYSLGLLKHGCHTYPTAAIGLPPGAR